MAKVWTHGDDVVLQVAGKYSLLGKTVGKQWDDGRVTVRWEDRTSTVIRGDLLVTPGEAAAAPSWAEVVQISQLIGERNRARATAVRLEQEVAFLSRPWEQKLVEFLLGGAR
jgi:hypothetical protein